MSPLVYFDSKLSKPESAGFAISRWKDFVVLNTFTVEPSGDIALAAGRAVVRLTNPFAELRTSYPQNVPQDQRLYLFQSAYEYSGADFNSPPVEQSLADRLLNHDYSSNPLHWRDADWSGYHLPNFEIDGFEKILDINEVAAYDSVYAAWVNGVKAAWPRCKVFGYLLPGNCSQGNCRTWGLDGTPPDGWLDIEALQPLTIAALDGFAPEFYLPATGGMTVANAKFPERLAHLKAATRYLRNRYPSKLLMPIVWLSYIDSGASDVTPCDATRPNETWKGSSGDDGQCGYNSLPLAHGEELLEAVRANGADGVWIYETDTDLGQWQAGSSNMTSYTSISNFLATKPKVQTSIVVVEQLLLGISGLLLWADAGYGVTAPDGELSNWVDRKTGTTLGFGFNGPAYLEADPDFNDNPSVEFVSADTQWVAFDSFANLLGGDDTPFTIIQVVKSTAAGSSQVWWGASKSGSSNGYVIGGQGVATDPYAAFLERDREATGESAVRNSSAASCVVGTVYIYVTIFSGTATTIYRNGTKIVDAEANDRDTLGTLDQFTIGALRRTSITNYANMKLAEMLLYDSISLNDINAVQNYLATKYNLTVSDLE